jgi:hypothetical protein
MLDIVSAVFAFVVLLVVVGVVIWGITLYKSLVQVKDNGDRAWSNVEVAARLRWTTG